MFLSVLNSNPMEQNLQIRQLKQGFPLFTQHELVKELLEKSNFLEVPSKTVLLEKGSIINVIPILTKGLIKVVRTNENGSEVFLYYVKPGETCALTLASSLKREKSSIKAVVDENSEILALPIKVAYGFIHKYHSWNDFMVDTYSRRFKELLDVMDSVCFQNIDARLIRYLKSKVKILLLMLINLEEIQFDLSLIKFCELCHQIANVSLHFYVALCKR